MRHAVVIKDLSITRSSDFELKLSRLKVPQVRVLCIVGANGSGKTTLLETLTNLIAPKQGFVSLFSQPLKLHNISQKRSVGFIPDDDTWVIPELTANEFFRLHASVYAMTQNQKNKMMKKLIELSAGLSFTQFSQQIGTLSHGNKKKVQIIAALMHCPKLIIVDELRNGLDPIAIKHAEQLLRAEVANGATVVAATHDLWWAERFCDDVLMLKDGKILLYDSTKQIVRKKGSLESMFMELYENA